MGGIFYNFILLRHHRALSFLRRQESIFVHSFFGHLNLFRLPRELALWDSEMISNWGISILVLSEVEWIRISDFYER
jgi:hypothetical protein